MTSPSWSLSEQAFPEFDSGHDVKEIRDGGERNEGTLDDLTPLSGVRAASSTVAYAEAALEAGARGAGKLQELHRTVKFLGASIAGAQHAHYEMIDELRLLREQLSSSQEHQADLHARVHELEAELNRAAGERAFLLAEHDAFIVDLVTQHERQLSEVNELLAESERKLQQ